MKNVCSYHPPPPHPRSPASLWLLHRNLFRQLSKDGNWHGSGMSHTTTACPEPSFKGTLEVGDAVVGRGNAGWTASKSGHPCPWQNYSQGPLAEKVERGSDDNIHEWTSLLMAELLKGPLAEKVERGSDDNIQKWTSMPMPELLKGPLAEKTERGSDDNIQKWRSLAMAELLTRASDRKN